MLKLTPTMTTLTALTAALVLLTGTALAEEACCPAHEQAAKPAAVAAGDAAELPAGHPPLPQGHPELPSGHPPLPGERADLPQGHPELPQGHPQLPGGHPDLPPGHAPMGGGGGDPMMQPFSGSLVVKAFQGTEGGPKLGAAKIEVAFVNPSNEVAYKFETQLDEHGVAMIEGLEFATAVQPYVFVTYNGVEFEGTGRPLSAQSPDQVLRVPVYELAEQAPDWSIAMRHVMLRKVESGLLVRDMLVLDVPGDRAWRGEKLKKAQGEHTHASLVLPVPDTAVQVQLQSGFDPCCTLIETGRIVATKPLMPGSRQLELTYIVPATDGLIELDVSPAAPVKHMMLFMADDGTTVQVTGLTQGPSMGEGDRKVRVYKAEHVDRGAATGLKMAADWVTKSAAATTEDTGATAKVVAGIGGGVLLTGAAVVLLVKPSSRAKTVHAAHRG